MAVAYGSGRVSVFMIEEAGLSMILDAESPTANPTILEWQPGLSADSTTSSSPPALWMGGDNGASLWTPHGRGPIATLPMSSALSERIVAISSLLRTGFAVLFTGDSIYVRNVTQYTTVGHLQSCCAILRASLTATGAPRAWSTFGTRWPRGFPRKLFGRRTARSKPARRGTGSSRGGRCSNGAAPS